MSKPNYNLLRDAAAIIDGIPPMNFRLSGWYKDRDKAPEANCGTIACALGWLALHPKFQALGLKPRHNWLGAVPSVLHYSPMESAARLFGITHDEAVDLFCVPGASTYDQHLEGRSTMGAGAWQKHMFDHRVRSFLRYKGQRVTPRQS